MKDATIEVGSSDLIDICRRSEEFFQDSNPLKWRDWYVTYATLRIVFHPEPGRTREKAVSIQLRAPNGSNLRDQTWQHQVLSKKVLGKVGAARSRRHVNCMEIEAVNIVQLLCDVSEASIRLLPWARDWVWVSQ